MDIKSRLETLNWGVIDGLYDEVHDILYYAQEETHDPKEWLSVYEFVEAIDKMRIITGRNE